MKNIIDELHLIKLKNFCAMKNHVKRMRKQATDWEKIFTPEKLIKDCYPKYTKNP